MLLWEMDGNRRENISEVFTFLWTLEVGRSLGRAGASAWVGGDWRAVEAAGRAGPLTKNSRRIGCELTIAADCNLP